MSENGAFNNLLEAGELAATHYSGMCYYWIAHKLVLLITKPEHISKLLITNDKNTTRGEIASLLQSTLGTNILSDPHEVWQKKRSIYKKYLYANEALHRYEGSMKDIIEQNIIKLCSNNGIVNLKDFSELTAVSMLINTVLSSMNYNDNTVLNLSRYVAKSGDDLFNFRNILSLRMPYIFRYLFFKNKNSVEELKIEMREMLKKALLEADKFNVKDNSEFIEDIRKIRDDDEDVFGDINALLFTGSDTTSGTLQFIIKLLAKHSDIEKKLCSELKEHLIDKKFTVENINKIDYLNLVIKEALRLYPVSPFIPRGVEIPFKINDIQLFQGDLVTYSPYITHYLKEVWGEDSKQFKPERFSKENIQDFQLNAYIPFGLGSHECVGRRYALQELKLLLATIYSSYRIEIEDNDFAVSLDQGTLKPKTPTLARFIPHSLNFQEKREQKNTLSRSTEALM
jgi:cytochrome P450 family 4